MKHEMMLSKQREVALAFKDSNPSEVTEVFWIYADREVGEYPEPTAQCGKYCVFEPVATIDEVWRKIKRATEDGLLGSSSKVATARPNENAKDDKKRVICVYTYNGDDADDRLRVREELRKLGIERALPYKKDAATLAGKYQVKGDQRISAYLDK